MKKRGSVLIFILWILIIFTVMSVILSRRASSHVRLAKYEADNIKSTYLGRAGVVKMLAYLLKDTNPYDSLNEEWSKTKILPKVLTVKKDRVLYSASDEGSRLNLNSIMLNKEQLSVFGLDAIKAEKIIEYRNEKPKHVFEFTEEVFLVEGITNADFVLFADFVTIYTGNDPKVNINTASEEVLVSVLQDEYLAGQVLDYRKGPDGKEGTEDDGIFRDVSDISILKGLNPELFNVRSSVYRISAQVFLDGHATAAKTIEAVINKNTAEIYNWKEL